MAELITGPRASRCPLFLARAQQVTLVLIGVLLLLGLSLTRERPARAEPMPAPRGGQTQQDCGSPVYDQNAAGFQAYLGCVAQLCDIGVAVNFLPYFTCPGSASSSGMRPTAPPAAAGASTPATAAPAALPPCTQQLHTSAGSMSACVAPTNGYEW